MNPAEKPRTGGGWLANPFSPSPLHSADQKLGWKQFPMSLSLNDFKPSSHRRLIPRPSLTVPPSPSTLRFVALCALWYASSALSSNTGKAILTQFRYPITLTFVQFGFVAFYCMLFMSPLVRFSRMRSPTKAIIRSTLPMGLFQVGGHISSSMAISRIPVSTVHTIKALSPLFTVAAYALLFRVSYSPKTYISLLPLTVGVMLACSFDMSASNAIGLLCAFTSALVFVSSNIFFKKVMPSTSGHQQQVSAHKLDKLNLLFYSSSMAFLLMLPIWLYYDLPVFLASAAPGPTHIAHPAHGHAAPHSVSYYFIMNGTVHFAQNIIAFIILASTSPVTYSIASLIKRVAVICIAFVWFAQSVHPVQGLGILLTFAGLWMYNRAKGDVAAGENKMRRVEAARDLVLPSTLGEVAEEEKVAAETTATRSASVTYGRARAASVTAPTGNGHFLPNPHLPPPPLQIMTTSHTQEIGAMKRLNAISPTEPYPSPPPSLDSPPSTPAPAIR